MPDTVEKHRTKLLAPYQQNPRYEAVVESAKRLALLILGCEELLVSHRKKMLKEVIWLISEADGKYSTRYRSAEVVRLARQEASCNVLIQHEHVFPKARVVDRLLADKEALLSDPQRLSRALDQTVACVVTKEEHRRLVDGDGWERYRSVAVLDMSTDPPSRVPETGAEA